MLCMPFFACLWALTCHVCSSVRLVGVEVGTARGSLLGYYMIIATIDDVEGLK